MYSSMIGIKWAFVFGHNRQHTWGDEHGSLLYLFHEILNLTADVFFNVYLQSTYI